MLAAGTGMRLRPITDTCPKALLPLTNGDVILDSIASNARGMGIQTLRVVARDWEPQFRQACERIAARNGIEASLQMLPAPTSSSFETLRFALRHSNAATAVFLGDDVTIAGSLMNLVEAYVRTGAVILQAVTREDDRLVLQRSCAVTIDGTGRIKTILEKPTDPRSNIRGCGVYILGESACQLVEDPGQASIHEITELVDHFAREDLAAYEFIAGINVNVNTPADLARAQQVYRLSHAEPRPSS